MAQAVDILGSRSGHRTGTQGIIQATGIVGLYLFSFCAVLSISGAQVALALMLVSFLAQARAVGRAIRKEPIVWLAGVWVLYMALSAAVGLDAFPATKTHQLHQARDWALLSLVVVAAWHFGGDVRRFTIAAALFALGASLRVLIHMPWEHLGPFLTGEFREVDTLGFGLNQISFSSYLAVIVLWLAVFSARIWSQLESRTARAAFLIFATLVSVVAIEGIIIGSSRGTWLATVVALLVLVVRWKPWTYVTPRIFWAVSAATVLTLAVIVVTHGANFLRRATIDPEVYAHIIEGDLDATEKEYTSTGIRVQMWIHALREWRERPLLGRGAGSERVLLEPLKPPPTLLRPGKTGRVPHSHNLLIELLMRFGIVGATLFLAFAGLIFWRLRSLHRGGQLAHDVYSFFFTLYVFVTVWSMFDIRIMRWDYRHFVFVFFGMALSLAWTAIRTARQNGRPAASAAALDSPDGRHAPKAAGDQRERMDTLVQSGSRG